jgi:hypothetical protein
MHQRQRLTNLGIQKRPEPALDRPAVLCEVRANRLHEQDIRQTTDHGLGAELTRRHFIGNELKARLEPA